jgi:hypothetical protein
MSEGEPGPLPDVNVAELDAAQALAYLASLEGISGLAIRFRSRRDPAPVACDLPTLVAALRDSLVDRAQLRYHHESRDVVDTLMATSDGYRLVRMG